MVGIHAVHAWLDEQASEVNRRVEWTTNSPPISGTKCDLRSNLFHQDHFIVARTVFSVDEILDIRDDDARLYLFRKRWAEKLDKTITDLEKLRAAIGGERHTCVNGCTEPCRCIQPDTCMLTDPLEHDEHCMCSECFVARHRVVIHGEGGYVATSPGDLL